MAEKVAPCESDGTFTHTRVPGDGVFAALLRAEGIRVLTEEAYLEELAKEN